MLPSCIENKHKNKLCFILGASPSLRHVAAEELSPYITICVNSSILKIENPNYFVSDDAAIMNWNYWSNTLRSCCQKFLFYDKFKNYFLQDSHDNILFYTHRYWSSRVGSRTIYHKENLRMHASVDMPIIGARSSVASAINIAYIMGCNPIILLGLDNCYEDNKRYFWQFENEPKAMQLTGFETKTNIYQNHENAMIDNHCVDYEIYWKQFAEINPYLCDGRILNASRNTILDAFPRMNLTEVFTKYGDRINV